MANKEERILITKVSSECRNLRFMDDNAELEGIEPGYYCAAYPHGGWEKIDQKECENCTREKYLTGITRQKALEVMAKAMCMQDNLLESCEHCITQCDKEKQKNMCEHILKKRKDNIEPSYFDKAEIALKALLEGGNK